MFTYSAIALAVWLILDAIDAMITLQDARFLEAIQATVAVVAAVLLILKM